MLAGLNGERLMADGARIVHWSIDWVPSALAHQP
jgi:hypothetical protein